MGKRQRRAAAKTASISFTAEDRSCPRTTTPPKRSERSPEGARPPSRSPRLVSLRRLTMSMTSSSATRLAAGSRPATSRSSGSKFRALSIRCRPVFVDNRGRGARVKRPPSILVPAIELPGERRMRKLPTATRFGGAALALSVAAGGAETASGRPASGRGIADGLTWASLRLETVKRALRGFGPGGLVSGTRGGNQKSTRLHPFV